MNRRYAIAGEFGGAELQCGDDQRCDGLICAPHPFSGYAEPLPAHRTRAVCEESLVRSCGPEAEFLHKATHSHMHTKSVILAITYCKVVICLGMNEHRDGSDVIPASSRTECLRLQITS